MPLEPTRRKLEERVLALEKKLLEQKALNEKLLTAQEEYRLLAESSTDVIWAADMSLRFSYFSPSVYQLRGYTPEEALTLGPEETFTPDSLALLLEEVRKLTTGRQGVSKKRNRHFCLELKILCKDGSAKWVECVGTLSVDNIGTPEGIHGIARDVTRHKNNITIMQATDKALSAKVLELEETNKAIALLTKEAEESARDYKNKMTGIIKRLSVPYMERFQETNPGKNQKICMDFIASCLSEMDAYMPGSSDGAMDVLNAKESEVARLVSIGCTSRDIARLLDIPKRSVDFYRAKIRKKLSFLPPGKSLSQYLVSLYRKN
ncbi:MAG: PAS domain S-box protein [Desulfatibacillum sp.]|nr:PAS domain S-box protein [Desulfatibacillum sp.]